MSNTRTELQALLNSKIVTGGSSTKAADLRTVIVALIQSLVSILDDKDQPEGYVGLDADSNAAVAGDLDVTGNATAQALTVTGKVIAAESTPENLYSTSDVPSEVIGAPAGSGAAAVITGTNECGTIRLTTGTGCASGTLLTLSFSDGYAYPNGSSVVLHPANAAAAGVFKDIIAAGGNSSFEIEALNALADSTAYEFNYIVKGF